MTAEIKKYRDAYEKNGFICVTGFMPAIRLSAIREMESRDFFMESVIVETIKHLVQRDVVFCNGHYVTKIDTIFVYLATDDGSIEVDGGDEIDVPKGSLIISRTQITGMNIVEGQFVAAHPSMKMKLNANMHWYMS